MCRHRRWQAAQPVELLDGRRARIVFKVSDLNKVARSEFGFGKDAKIVSPPEAVRVAAEPEEKNRSRKERRHECRDGGRVGREMQREDDFRRRDSGEQKGGDVEHRQPPAIAPSLRRTV